MSSDRQDHLRGLVLGAAIGDALGAPFEFGPAGAFSNRFPAGSTVNEMVGGGVWQPGEFTDDTQMAIIEAESILELGCVDRQHTFDRFRGWVQSRPKDVGISTRAVLSDPSGWPSAPKKYFQQHPRGAAGNGSLMRASFVASRWSTGNIEGTAEIARYFSSVTHGDPAAGEGRALFQMMCQVASRFVDPFERMDRRIGFLKDGLREPYAQAIADPNAGLPNGTVWGCFRDAYWAVKRSDSFEEAMYNACDVGGDVDTVAAVAGGLAGVIYGPEEIPQRWLETVHGNIGTKTYRANDLVELIDQLRSLHIPEEKFWKYGIRHDAYKPKSTKPPEWDQHHNNDAVQQFKQSR